MAELENTDLLDGEDDLGTDDALKGDDDGSKTTLDPQAAELATLKAEVAALRNLNTSQSRDLIAAVGRLQSLADKVEQTPADDPRVAGLTAQMEAANEMLDALLDDEAVDPKVKERAQRARSNVQAKTDRQELEALKREVAAMKAPKSTPAPDAGLTKSSFEVGVETAILAAGLDPDDALFDWGGEATRLLRSQGPAVALTYFKTQIAAGLEAKAAAGRRQGRKTAGGTQTTPGGDGTDPLDESRPQEERLRWMRANHII